MHSFEFQIKKTLVITQQMAIPTSNLSDLYPSDLKYMDSIFKSYGQTSRFSGPIATISCFEDIFLIKDLLSQPGNGQVLLIDGGGSDKSALFDETLALEAINNNWAGIIINGRIRQSNQIKNLPIGVKAIGESVRKSSCRNGGEMNGKIEMAGVEIAPGDLVIADEDGVVVFEKKEITRKIKPKF